MTITVRAVRTAVDAGFRKLSGAPLKLCCPPPAPAGPPLPLEVAWEEGGWEGAVD
jgi:hypothetical protein